MKRSYPFEDHFTNQRKFHVGEKEVNQGVQSNDKMQAVYAKTMQKLFNGSRNLLNNNVPMSVAKSTASPAMGVPRMNGLRQMALTPRGGICYTGANASSQVAGGPAEPYAACSTCRSGAPPTGPCSFCESPLCGACVASCCRCMGNYCRHCRVVVYDRHDDVTVCLSCNR